MEKHKETVATEETMKSEVKSQKEELEHVTEKPRTMRRNMLLVYALLIVSGVTTGYLLSRATTPLSSAGKPKMINTGKVAGVTDERTFKDSAVGTIEKGGIDGEGTHKLVREGGESQTAFLTSSVVDLDQYVGKKVKVWGQTFDAEKAAWLMDVGKIEIQQ
ncbi:hypothetical protein HY950_01950 [Candidatus Gottesmanbacteria bacterium]|nr:hypothetical protein [Candidatus Gottesmanbacteria bacterium]